MAADRPAHHLSDGTFRVPWPMEGGDERGPGALLRWQWERLTSDLPPNPSPGELPLAESDVAHPRAPADEVRITWVGHATFLVQAGGLNLLTDPVWSRRASPLRWAGPARFVPPGVAWDRLPPIDAVLLSHDHYDHLDDATVRRLRARFGDGLRWLTPLAYREWLGARGITNVTELDWWEETELEGPAGPVRAACLPVQHWTRRGLTELNARLWGSWLLAAPGDRRVYFGGDSGYFPGFREIGERHGPLDAALLPIGAYEPRWFMRPAHMNPEEAVRAYRDLGGSGLFVGMHWGTFRLTDEDPLEPPVRTRAAWAEAGLPPSASGSRATARRGWSLALWSGRSRPRSGRRMRRGGGPADRPLPACARCAQRIASGFTTCSASRVSRWSVLPSSSSVCWRRSAWLSNPSERA